MPPLPPLPALPDHMIAFVATGCALVALIDYFFTHRLIRSKAMSQVTLGDDFASYLNAASTLLQAQATLKASETALDAAKDTFHTDLQASGVKALLAPSTSPNGDTPVALVGDDGSISIIVAAAPSTPVQAPNPTPAPNPAPAPA